MKIIKNSDIKFRINKKLVYLPNFTIRFYTVNQKEYFLEKTQDDLVEYEREATVDDVDVILSGGTTVTEYYLPLNWNQLMFVGKGVLNYKLTNNIEDPEFPDYQYNKEEVVTTDFYIDSIEVDPEPEEGLIERIVLLEEHLAEEIVNREEADATITENLNAEEARAISAETELSEALTSETSRAISAETVLDEKIDAETNRATSAETALDEKIDAEETRASGEEQRIEGKLDQEIADRQTDVNTEEARAISAETALDAKIDAETNRATTAESALTDTINAEANRATAAEAALDVKIDTVSGNVISETSRATTAENALSGAVDTLINSKASQSDLDALNGVVTAHTADTTVHVTTSDKTKWNKVDDKLDVTDFNTYSGTVDTALNNKADTSAVTAVQDSLSGYVYTADNGKQDIYGKKTFIGTKRLNFTQAKSSDKLGFTLYDVRDEQGNAKEFAAFELNPIGITENGVVHPLLTLNHYRTNSGRDVQTYFGYRQYDQPHSASYHLLVPLPEIAKTPLNLTATVQNFYFPLGFKNGSTMIKADNAGVVNLSSEFGGKVNTSDFETYSGTVETKLNTISGAVDTKLDATAYTPTVVDSALDSGSTNPVENQALYDELRIDNGGETETTLTFEGNNTTNYPEGCTKIKVEDIALDYTTNTITFIDDGGGSVGEIVIDTWGSISVDTSRFQSATYEIDGTTVTISYPNVTTVAKLNKEENSNYTYKAVTTEPPTVLKDQVVENATALVGKVDTSAITTSVTSSSTDAQVPSAKAVYDIVGNIETLLSQI